MSRFDEHFDRDLGAIAERITPSPDAWEEIQLRIADREPTRDTEIIMLVENTTTPRRWPLLAAAAAVVALVVGAVALVATGDDDTGIPADDPAVVVTPAPDVIDDGTSVDNDGSDDAATETARQPVDVPVDDGPTATARYGPTIVLDPASNEWIIAGSGAGLGEFTSYTEPDENGVAAYAGEFEFFGDITGLSTHSGVEQYRPPHADGSFNQASTGEGPTEASVTIDGVGTGQIVGFAEWQANGEGTVRGRSTVTGGTGELDGITGWMIWSSSYNTTSLAYTFEFRLPADGRVLGG